MARRPAYGRESADRSRAERRRARLDVRGVRDVEPLAPEPVLRRGRRRARPPCRTRARAARRRARSAQRHGSAPRGGARVVARQARATRGERADSGAARDATASPPRRRAVGRAPGSERSPCCVGTQRATPHALLLWQAAIDDFTRLTPIIGAIGYDDALAELQRSLERAVPDPLPVRGIHVLGRIDDVGPGYEAAWITGFTDASWPEPARCNPLLAAGAAARARNALVHAAGRAAALRAPARAPAHACRHARRELARAALRLRDRAEPRDSRLARARSAGRSRPRRARSARRARETCRRSRAAARRHADPRRRPHARPSVALPGACVLPGSPRRPRARRRDDGTRRQAARHRDASRARATCSRTRKGDRTSPRSRRMSARPRERALARIFRAARRPLRALFELEAERVAATLRRLLAKDATRAPFEVSAIERKQIVTIAGRELEIRIDRSTASLTAASRSSTTRPATAHRCKDWLGTGRATFKRRSTPRMPAEPVGALAIARVQPREAAYFGYWNAGALFPDAVAKLPDDGWERQITRWRATLEELVLEHAAGDTRIFLDDFDDAAGAYAPLTRVHEQLAIATRLGGALVSAARLGSPLGRARPDALVHRAGARGLRQNRALDPALSRFARDRRGARASRRDHVHAQGGGRDAQPRAARAARRGRGEGGRDGTRARDARARARGRRARREARLGGSRAAAASADRHARRVQRLARATAAGAVRRRRGRADSRRCARVLPARGAAHGRDGVVRGRARRESPHGAARRRRPHRAREAARGAAREARSVAAAPRWPRSSRAAPRARGRAAQARRRRARAAHAAREATLVRGRSRGAAPGGRARHR